MPIFFLDLRVQEPNVINGGNILPLVLVSVFAIGTLAAIFFWYKNNKNK